MLRDEPHSVESALAKVLSQAHRLPPQVASLTSALLGLVLAEDVYADRDSPPFAKSLVDGFAVRCQDDTSERRVVMEITAGATPSQPLAIGEAARVTTGAMLPAGADAVVMQEQVEPAGAERIRLLRQPRAGENVLPQGAEMRRGELILSAGTVIRPAEIGVLASVGKTAVPVYRQPVVAILPTGDELVEPGMTPGPGQIRNSNAAMLAALVARNHALPRYLGIARDTLDSLRPLVREGLKCDVLVLSGGVSVGPLDLVPQLLQEEGVQLLFHKVSLKPGKPLLFRGVQRQAGVRITGQPGKQLRRLRAFCSASSAGDARQKRTTFGLPPGHFRCGVLLSHGPTYVSSGQAVARRRCLACSSGTVAGLGRPASIDPCQCIIAFAGGRKSLRSWASGASAGHRSPVVMAGHRLRLYYVHLCRCNRLCRSLTQERESACR
jgi:molybdopterin molybdotransferase